MPSNATTGVCRDGPQDPLRLRRSVPARAVSRRATLPSEVSGSDSFPGRPLLPALSLPVEAAMRHLRGLFFFGSAMLALSATGGCSRRSLPTEPLGLFASYKLGVFASYKFVRAWGD